MFIFHDKILQDSRIHSKMILLDLKKKKILNRGIFISFKSLNPINVTI